MAGPPPTLIVNNVRVFNGTDADLVEGHLVVAGDRIDQVAGDAPTPAADVTVIDGGGRVLVPGLTDAHMHLMGTCNTLVEMMTADIDELYAKTVAEAEQTLLRGFTTIRDVGGPVFGIKSAIDKGAIPGPRIYPSGALISQTAGHGDFSMLYDQATALGGVPSRGEDIGFTRIADGPDRVTAAVREQLKQGASQVKLMAGGGVSSLYDGLDTVQFTPPEVHAAVAAAADWGTYVAVHVYTTDGVRRAVDAGVRSIEHAHLVDEDTVAYMADKNVWLSTQPFAEHDHSFPDPDRTAKNAEVCSGTANLYQWAAKHGVKTAFGTDLLMEPEKAANQPVMFARLSEFMDPVDALRMATSTNAELFRMAGKRDPYAEAPMGVVAPGAWADFLLVDGDPTTDLSPFADPDTNLRLIVKGGKVYKNTL
ncbi:MAG: amidohydrolase family protein [Acidimicrobiia bacterium]|nr:amidohydrolase family protein [Acidimicrobiia bacterium]